MQHLLENLDQGSLIGPHIAPFLSRIDAIISDGAVTSKEIRKRIKLISMASRKQSNEHFSTIGAALFKRQRLEIVYYGRARDDTTTREISPQRLVHYRDNWYLDAWCHMRNGLRGFSIDNIKSVNQTTKKAIDASAKSLEEELATSYGIFAGQAKLRFSAVRAKWVASETWHIDQRNAFDEQGRYILEFPYSDDRELVLDIMRHGASVEVLAPKSLRDKVIAEHQAAIKTYQ